MGDLLDQAKMAGSNICSSMTPFASSSNLATCKKIAQLLAARKATVATFVKKPPQV
jgi:hypothetical protein